MCGRAACTLDPEAIKKTLKVNGKVQNEEVGEKKNFNAAPMQRLPVVYHHDGERCLNYMQWGLLPFFMKDAKGQRSINARSETVTTKASFRHLIGKKRCVIPADGYYEWLAGMGKEKKTPYFFRLPDSDITPLAGLYDVWVDKEGQRLYTFVILTVAAAPSVQFIHERMPAILTLEKVDQWLNPDTSVEEAVSLLQPYEGKLDFWAVSDLVSKVGMNVPECVIPVSEVKKETKGIASFFKPVPKTDVKREMKHETHEESADAEDDGEPIVLESDNETDAIETELIGMGFPLEDVVNAIKSVSKSKKGGKLTSADVVDVLLSQQGNNSPQTAEDVKHEDGAESRVRAKRATGGKKVKEEDTDSDDLEILEEVSSPSKKIKS